MLAEWRSAEYLVYYGPVDFALTPIM
jgi:hypothetical protein